MDKYRISYSIDNFGEITVIGNGLKIKELIEEGNPVNRIEFVRNTPDRKKEMEMMMELRKKTGCGLMDAKESLQMSDYDMDKAEKRAERMSNFRRRNLDRPFSDMEWDILIK